MWYHNVLCKYVGRNTCFACVLHATVFIVCCVSSCGDILRVCVCLIASLNTSGISNVNVCQSFIGCIAFVLHTYCIAHVVCEGVCAGVIRTVYPTCIYYNNLYCILRSMFNVFAL